MRVMAICMFMAVVSGSIANGQNAAESVISSVKNDIETKRQEFESSVATLTASAVASLEQVANSAVANGDPALAAQAWKEVLRIDPNHERGRAFFTSFGSLEKTLREVTAKAKANKPPNRTEWASLSKTPQQEPIALFKKIGDKEWVELDSNKNPVFRFRETTSNSDFIEIYDIDRRMRVRIHATIFYVQGPQRPGPNHWESNSIVGTWIN